MHVLSGRPTVRAAASSTGGELACDLPFLRLVACSRSAAQPGLRRGLRPKQRIIVLGSARPAAKSIEGGIDHCLMKHRTVPSNGPSLLVWESWDVPHRRLREREGVPARRRRGVRRCVAGKATGTAERHRLAALPGTRSVTTTQTQPQS